MQLDSERSTNPLPAPAQRAAGLLLAIGGAATAGAAALLWAHRAATADTHSSEGLLLAAAWWVAAALFAWLIATSGASTAARAMGAWRTATWLDVVTVPAVRKLLDRVLVVTIATSTLVPIAAQAAGATTPRQPRVEQFAAAPQVRRHALPDVRRHAVPDVRRHAEPQVRRHAEPQVRRHAQGAELLASPPIVRGATTTTAGALPRATRPTTSAPATTPAPAAPAPSAPPTARAPRGTVPAGNAHVVVRDDNLWTIAAARLARAGTAPDNAAIARYWQRVITRNEARLRSGNPNLIFPGEVIWLPPVDRAG